METIASHITEKRIFENGRVFIAPTGAKDVVTVEGSVLGGFNHLPHEQLSVPGLAAHIFDAGTKLHAKAILRESLAARGAHIGFTSGGDRTYFSGSCLPEDLPFLLQTIAECLTQPLFATSELATARTEFLGRLKENKTDTSAQAAQEFSRLIYDPKHVNYAEKDTTVQKMIESVTRKELQSFQKILGKNNLILAVVGDVAPQKALAAVEKAFKPMPAGVVELPIKAKNKKAQEKEQKQLFIPHKTSVDVFVGAAIPLMYEDELFMPFKIAVDMLGGGFAAHLMQTVRERDGLTYRTYAATTGFQNGSEGAFQAYASFAPELYEQGLTVLQKEIRSYLTNGLTSEELESKKEEIVGSYAIGLATTSGMAGRLHFIGERGHELSYIDEYITKVNGVQLASVQEAARLIPLDKLAIAAAGTFVK